MTRIVVDFSGGVNGFNAESVATYALTVAGKKGSFAARNARHLRLRSAVITPCAKPGDADAEDANHAEQTGPASD